MGIFVPASDRSLGEYDIVWDGSCTKRQNHGRVRCESTLYHGVFIFCLFLISYGFSLQILFLWLGMDARVLA